MNTVYFTFLSLLWGTSAGVLTWYIATVARQITYVTLADGRKQERKLPILFRMLLPLTPNVMPFMAGLAFAPTKEKMRRALIAAGFEGLLHENEFLALRVLLPLVIGPIWIGLMAALISITKNSFLMKMDVLLYLVGPTWFFIYPVLWLKQTLGKRHRSIQKSLPFVLDLLTLSVEAGMDFMTALQRNVERRTIDALGEELIRVIREIQIGKTRREALRDMSYRVNLSDLRSVVNSLVQADELGVSIGSILRIQADQIRQRRFERAEALANQAPVKMLGPLLFFIFPAVFLILLGPIMARLMESM
ncbi:MAG: type II secretion system F family protein [Kiritimatiellae bacterium]|nr:type II secretion system F family protein [Kiritimatiellia bacterium]MDD5520404.1 type II secretion system F family protein [Kiritimatiellia bacterium]